MDLKETGWGVCSGFSWLRIGTVGGLLWMRWWTFGFGRHGVSFLEQFYRLPAIPCCWSWIVHCKGNFVWEAFNTYVGIIFFFFMESNWLYVELKFTDIMNLY
jgi:hypothetical protein